MKAAARSRLSVDEHLARADPDLGHLIAAVTAEVGRQSVKPSLTPPFEALVKAIVYQSVSGKAAAAIFLRLKAALNSAIIPAKVVALSPQELMKLGLSGAKARSIRALGEWFTTNRELAKALPTLSDAEIVETLTAIPGIGAWTVNVFLIFNLGRPDVLPAADRGIRRGMQLAYRMRDVATVKEVLERSQRWLPYRSTAAKYLWQAAKLKRTQNHANEERRP
jgi:DNA-3-methyladenine glycosylase II